MANDTAPFRSRAETHDHLACGQCLPHRLAVVSKIADLDKRPCGHPKNSTYCACVKVRVTPLTDDQLQTMLMRSW